MRSEGRGATSHRVEVTQDGRAVVDAMVWSTAEAEGLEHDETEAPDVPGPDELDLIQDLLPDEAQSPYPFWDNFDAKPVDFEAGWPPDGPRAAQWREWLRFRPSAVFEDPWTDAARRKVETPPT